MVNVPAIPPTPAGLAPALRQQLSAIAQAVNTLLGATGNGSGAAATLGTLAAAGLVSVSTSGQVAGMNVIDYTPPPAPAGLSTSGALGNVILTWDNPSYSNHSYTEIWREQVTFTGGVADPSIIGNAVKIGTSAGIVGVYADATGAASDCWYWVKFVSTASVAGPFNAVSGVRGTTSASPAYLLSVLSSSITSSQLAADLSAPIALVTTPANLAASSSTALAQANNAAQAALQLLLKADALKIAAQRTKWITDATSTIDPSTGKVTLLATAQISTDVEARLNQVGIGLSAIDGTVISHTASLASQGTRISASETSITQMQGSIALKASSSYVDGSIANVLGVIDPASITASQNNSAIGLLQTLLDNNASRTLAQSNGARASVAERTLTAVSDAISAQATERVILAAHVDNNLAALVAEASTRATADTANAASISTLSAQVNDATTGLQAAHAAVVSESSARATGDAATASAAAALLAQVNEVTTGLPAAHAAITTEAAVRAAADSAISTSITSLTSTVNAKVTTFVQATAPTATATGDLWVDTANENLLKRWSGIVWMNVRDTTIATAQTAANNAATLAGSKTVSFVQATAPTALAVGDMWIDTSMGNLLKRWSGAAWIAYQDMAISAVSAALTTEQTTRATADAANANSIQTLWSQVNDITTGLPAAQAAIINNAATAATASAANASSITTLQSSVSAAQTTANTAVTNAATAQGAANAAQTTSNTALTNAATANTALTNIASDNILSPSEKPAIVQDYGVITSEQSGIDAQATAYGITTEKTAYDNAVSALTTYLGTLTGWNTVPGSDVVIVGTTFRSKFSDVYTARQALLNAIAAKAKTLSDTAQSAAAAAQTTANTGVTNAATAQTTANTAVTTSSANATSISTLQTTVGGHTTSIQTAQTSIDGLSATYAIKIDNNGVMSGFGLTSSLVAGGAPTSQFIASVNQFAVIAPGRTAGTLGSVPFAVLTTAQTINGVAFQPGVYIDGNSINNGTVTGNAIAAGAVTADKITAVNLSAISANMGSITAGSMNINNQFIVDSAGNMTANSGTFSGSLNGADITGASGTFGGLLAAGVVDITKLIGVTTNYLTPGTYTLTVPADKTSMQLTLFGAGSGAAGAATYNPYAQGGKAGSLAVATFTGLTPGATYSLTVGAGSNGATFNSNAASASGGATSVTGLLTATGGVGVLGVSSSPQSTFASTSVPGQGVRGKGGDPVYGASGGNGHDGFAVVEFFNPNGVVLQAELNTLNAALSSQGIAITGTPSPILNPVNTLIANLTDRVTSIENRLTVFNLHRYTTGGGVVMTI